MSEGVGAFQEGEKVRGKFPLTCEGDAMIQVQFVLNFKDGDNHIQLNILEREDANELEREMAQHIQELHVAIMTDLKDQLPDSEIELTVIE